MAAGETLTLKIMLQLAPVSTSQAKGLHATAIVWVTVISLRGPVLPCLLLLFFVHFETPSFCGFCFFVCLLLFFGRSILGKRTTTIFDLKELIMQEY